MSILYGITTERLYVATGIDVACPRFAWKIKSAEKNIVQEKYRIVVKSDNSVVWDSGEVASRDMVVRYQGDKLCAVSHYIWEVTVWLSNGEVISGMAEFMTGLGETGFPEECKWITYPDSDRDTVAAFRKEFGLGKKIKDAKLFTTSCGIYEAFINGKRVSHTDKEYIFELKPGFTGIIERKFYHSFDITHMVEENNCFSVILTGGWWSDAIVLNKGEQNCFKALLLLTYEDGTTETIVTDENIKTSTKQPVVKANIYYGEDYDARFSTDFMKFGFDDSEWEKSAVTNVFKGVVESMHGVPVVNRADRCREAVDVYTYCGVKDAVEDVYGEIDNVTHYDSADFILKKGETAVVDFGQNAAGRICFTVSGKKGTKISIAHGEMLNDRKGEKSRGNDGPGGSVYIENMRSARAGLTYIIGEDDKKEEYRPLFTFFGFRYVSITAEEDVHFYDMKGEVLTNISYDSGTLVTDNTLVNKLIENSRWGMYSNYLSVPTDCPQRDERVGWMADTQVYIKTAHYYSTAAQTMLEKWGQDMRDSQSKDEGYYTCVSPRSVYTNELGSVGWADAGILSPYYVYSMTKDSTFISEHYESMKIYMDVFLGGRGNLGPQECFGDWLSFEPNDDELQRYLCVCFLAFDAMLMSQMADIIGKKDDAEHYAKLYDNQKQYFIEQYVNEDGTIKLSQQTAALYALRLDLLPDENSKQKVQNQLVDNITANGNRLQTGFLGTAILMPTLSELGLTELAYTLLLQEQMPSWLYSVNAGATTIWERWNSYSKQDGFGDVSMNSFNHYAYGCVSEWMFGYMAGIRPIDAGFNHFKLAPEVDARIGSVKAKYDSLSGEIESAWEFDGDKVLYRCVVPANCSAVLVNPFNKEETMLQSGEYEFTFEK